MHRSLSLSLHFFSLNLFAWAHNSNQKAKQITARESTSTFLTNQCLPFARASFVNPDLRTWNLFCIDSTSWSMCLKAGSFCPHFLHLYNNLPTGRVAYLCPRWKTHDQFSQQSFNATISSVLLCPSSFAFPLLIAAFSSSCARTRDSKTHFMCPLIQRLHDEVYSLPFVITPPPFLAFQMTFSECHLHSCYSY